MLVLLVIVMKSDGQVGGGGNVSGDAAGDCSEEGLA